jgi:Flp pilus assembly protein TadD
MSPAILRALRRAAASLLTKAPACVLLFSASAYSASAQAIGAHRGEAVSSGGGRAIQGRIISPTGKLPESRIRVTLEQADSGPRVTYADVDGGFNFNGLEGGPYTISIDAGKEFEVARESVYIEGGKPIYNVPVYLRLRPEVNPALAGVPKAAVDLFQKALDAEQKKDNDRALTLLNDAVAQHPQFALAHNELGVIYMRAGKLDKAIEEYKTATATLPDDPMIQLNYGTALTQKKEFPEAEKQLKRALKKLDKSATGHFYLGISYVGQKNIDAAEAEFQQAAKLGGDQMGSAHKYLGGILWQKGDKKRAADELETYLKLSPKAPDAEQIRGTIKQLRGGS